MKRIVLAAWLVIGSVAAGAQQEWVHVGQDPGHTKYSTLDQINVDNVQTLQRAWTFHTGDKTGFFESTPLVVSDVMYVSAQNGVFALDPATGAQRWKFETLGNTRRAAAGTYSTLAPFTIVNPPNLQNDFALTRTFKLSGAQSVQLRWEVFNVANT